MSNAISLKARIRNVASKKNIPAHAVLQYYMMERLLERISVSQYKDSFIIKGGMIIASLVGLASRTTVDMDTTVRGIPLNEESVRSILQNICDIQTNDGATLALDNIKPIRIDNIYGGYRALMTVKYGKIRTPIKLDMTTGDQVIPEPTPFTFQSLIDERSVQVWAYNIETILAEKVETILRRGALNTRLRDFYDVYILIKTQHIDMEIFKQALKATSEYRMSTLALENKDKILNELYNSSVMRQQWDHYCKTYGYAAGIGYDMVMKAVEDIVRSI
ncbi:MAG: nucleotidyl transferase AbiEii/AbiGii toxin family protein [Anaerolineales bacterium]|nr:nucleotidyl transferase AbiEii/AbiGii toxin family protein [Anaerolineales bacterium]